jgi:two-component system OmpR family response regulator
LSSPSPTGPRLLALRARGIVTPAIATSAEIDAAIASQLHTAGFVDIIEKPATLATLERVLGPHLHFSPEPLAAVTTHNATVPFLDDDAALSAIGGDANALRALRGLLAQELNEVLTQSASADLRTHAHVVAWRERLHRLRASCGFCGAAALTESAMQLDRGLRDDAENAQTLLRDFVHVCRKTLTVLRDQGLSATDGARTSPSIPQARKPAPSR